MEMQLTPRELSGAATLTLEDRTIVVDDGDKTVVFPLAPAAPSGSPHEAARDPLPRPVGQTSPFPSNPGSARATTTESAWKVTKGMRQHSTSRVAALAHYRSVIKIPTPGARAVNRTVKRVGWLLLGPDREPVAWLGNATESYASSPIYEPKAAREFADRAGIGYVDMGKIPHPVLMQKVRGVASFGSGTSRLASTAADSRQWCLAGITLGGMVACIPLFLHLKTVLPSLILLWGIVFGFGGLLFGAVASVPFSRHYQRHRSTGMLWGLGVCGAALLAAGTALTIPAAAEARAAHASTDDALEVYGLWWKVMLIGLGFLLFVMPWHVRMAVAAAGDRPRTPGSREARDPRGARKDRSRPHLAPSPHRRGDDAPGRGRR